MLGPADNSYLSLSFIIVFSGLAYFRRHPHRFRRLRQVRPTPQRYRRRLEFVAAKRLLLPALLSSPWLSQVLAYGFVQNSVPVRRAQVPA